jgi:predicted enzyme related to lactoylglutathione lyase
MAGELTFFEIGVEDTERGRAFDEGLFRWRFEAGPSGQGFAITAPNLPGGMHGGDTAASPYLFFRVDDIESAERRVRDLGGEVLEVDIEGDEQATARFGPFRLCRDDQARGSACTSHHRPRSGGHFAGRPCAAPGGDPPARTRPRPRPAQRAAPVRAGQPG